VENFREEDIQHVCGIFDSNAFESSSPSRVPCRGEANIVRIKGIIIERDEYFFSSPLKLNQHFLVPMCAIMVFKKMGLRSPFLCDSLFYINSVKHC
jgi:hypothetical protein